MKTVSTLAGEDSSKEEVLLVLTAITRLRGEPFLSMDLSIDVTDSLEDSSLDIDPPQFGYLVDFLSD